jgi:hypothetical protein
LQIIIPLNQTKGDAKMARITNFIVVHNDPKISWTKVEENWVKLTKVELATWVRTFFNKKEGVRYCLWLAPDEDALKSIFTDLNISWESILQVEETVPDLWGKKWQEHIEAEQKADTLAF